MPHGGRLVNDGPSNACQGAAFRTFQKPLVLFVSRVTGPSREARKLREGHAAAASGGAASLLSNKSSTSPTLTSFSSS